jgi:hypothetical protein
MTVTATGPSNDFVSGYINYQLLPASAPGLVIPFLTDVLADTADYPPPSTPYLPGWRILTIAELAVISPSGLNAKFKAALPKFDYGQWAYSWQGCFQAEGYINYDRQWLLPTQTWQFFTPHLYPGSPEIPEFIEDAQDLFLGSWSGNPNTIFADTLYLQSTSGSFGRLAIRLWYYLYHGSFAPPASFPFM